MMIVTASPCSICTTVNAKAWFALTIPFQSVWKLNAIDAAPQKIIRQIGEWLLTLWQQYLCMYLDIYIYIHTYILYIMWPHANMSTIFLSRCKQISQAECGQLAQSTVGNGFSCWVWTLDPICYRDCHITGTAFLCYDSFSKHMTFCCTKVGRPI